MSAAATWWVFGLTAASAFALKLVGYVVPERVLANPRLQRINALMPIVLLSALVVTEGLVDKTRVVLDHRLAGLAAAILALILRAPFWAVVLVAALASAIVVHLH